MRVKSSFGLTVVLATLVSACAGFRGGKLEAIHPWPVPAGSSGPKSLSYSIRSEFFYNGKLVLESGALGSDYGARHIELMYKESGLFSSVSRSRDPADLFAEMRYTQRLEDSIGLAVLCGLTLTMFPAASSGEFRLVTTFKDGSGNELGTIEKSETLSAYIQAFLIFLTPFKFPAREQAWVVNDLARATIQDGHGRKWF